MATNQNTRPEGSSRTGRSTATKKKSTGLLGGLLGGSKKPAPQTKKPAAQAQRRSASAGNGTAAQRSGQTRQGSAPTQRTPEEIARRRAAMQRAQRQQAASEELAARRAQQRQAASEQLAAAQESLPEEVFNTAQQKRQELTPEEKKRAQMRKKSARRTKERKEEARKAANRPSVTYTQPLPFNLNKLLLQLAVVIAVVLAVVIGLSVFFNVERVVIYGNEAYSAWTIQEASGIENGQSLLGIGRPRACGKIITALPYVKTARIGIKLPDTVNIYIEEFEVSYAVEAADESWWLITSSGKIAEQIEKAAANNYTKILGIQLVGPMVGEQAVALEVFEPEATEAEGATEETEEPLITVTANDRLKAALQILESLEANEIVGEIASVNVTSLFNLELMYGQRYQVKLGDTSKLDKKISEMKQSVAQLNEYQSGILDVSYITWPDGPFYTPLA